jgi:peptide/nickel transport system substrate-binding protein
MKSLCVLLATALLAACAPVGSRHTTGSVLAFSGLAGEPDSLNPMLSNEADLYDLSHLYMSYLVENDDRGGTIGEIAREVPTQGNGGISSDLRTIMYRIRRGVRWQDGVALTARDVVFSYRQIVNPRNNVPTRVGYDEITEIAAPDDYTVVVRLRRRFAPFVQYFFGPQGVGAILPAHLLSGRPDLNRAAYNQSPVGSGPFRIVRWRHGDSITLAANPIYWRGKPKIGQMIYRIIPDPSTRLEQLRTGEVDAYFDVDPQLLPQMRPIAGVRVTLTPVNDEHIVRFNLRDASLRDSTVRRAIAMAIDRQKLIAAATHGSGLLVNADQPRYGWAYDASAPSISYDPKESRRLLAGRTLTLTLSIAPSIVNGSALVASIVQENLRQIGIRVIIKQYPSGMFYAPASAGGVLAAGRYQLAYDAWWVLGDDPDDTWNFACDQLPPAGLNYSFWCDSRANAAMYDALASVDRGRRKADYAVVQRAVAQQLPIFPLWQVRIPSAYRTYVHGIAPAPMGSTFWNAWSWSVSS